jgi:ribonuclease BN (tRNA processing enzyme)
VRLTVVGCSGSFPGPDSAASCYLVEAGGHRVLLDLGSGALGSLASHVDIYSLDAVLLSHLHADHFFDVCSLFVARRYRPGPPLPRLPLYGPPRTAQRLLEAYGPGMDVAGQFEVTEWSDGRSVEVGPLRVRVARTAHPVPTFALRLEHEGRSLVYSGDTGACPRLVDLARDADLLLCEAGFQGEGNPPGLHLTGREAAEHATAAGVRRLVLTHVPPWHDPQRTLAEARPAFDGPLDVARAGAAYDV